MGFNPGQSLALLSEWDSNFSSLERKNCYLSYWTLGSIDFGRFLPVLLLLLSPLPSWVVGAGVVVVLLLSLAKIRREWVVFTPRFPVF